MVVKQKCVEMEFVVYGKFVYDKGLTNKEVVTLDKVTSSESIKAINEQAKYAVPQTAVPGNIWTAPQTFTQGIIDGTVTLDNMATALETLNASIEASK